jgi:hypothetical protein
VVGVTPLPQLSSLLAASLDKQLTMTDVERRIAVKTLTGAQLLLCEQAFAVHTVQLRCISPCDCNSCHVTNHMNDCDYQM